METFYDLYALIAIFQELSVLPESFLKILSREEFRPILHFLNEKYFVCFVIEEVKTCKIDVCHKSLFKL